jgi:hypothetical protein
VSEEGGLRIRVTPRTPAPPEVLSDGMEFAVVDGGDSEELHVQLPAEPVQPVQLEHPAEPQLLDVNVRPGRIRLSAVRKRVAEAMRCPFCRDAVTREGAAACAKSSCGALYHQECWEECRTGYGGCAVFGCGSTEAHGLTRIDFAMRMLRMLLAVILFPPRIISAVRELRKHPDGRTLFRGATKKALAAVSSFWGPQSSESTIFIKLGLLIPGYVLVYFLMVDLELWKHEWTFLPVMLGVPMGVVLISYALAVGMVLGLTLAKSFLAGEFEMLTRLASGGGYLGKMVGGGKKKKG